MRRILVYFLALLLAALPMLASAEITEEYAHARFRGRKIVGGAVIIAKDGEIVFSTAYGFKDGGRDLPVTLDTCFRIASVTKLVTCVGLMKLIEEKNISLETPVSDIVGYPVVNPSFPDEPITIRQVLSHTSSLEQTMNYYPDWENLKPWSQFFSQKYGPGEKYSYANLNGGLIGSMIEALSGQSVNDYMQQHVFDPLGINAAYHAGLLRDTSDVGSRMNKEGRQVISGPRAVAAVDEFDNTCNPRAHTGYTSGALYISANGLHRIITMLQLGGELDGVRILQPETVELMMQPQHLIPGSSVKAESPYGLCMYREENMPGGTWYGHQGRYDGLTSNMYFQPDTGLSVTVIANGYSALAKDDIVTIARVFMEEAQQYVAEESVPAE